MTLAALPDPRPPDVGLQSLPADGVRTVEADPRRAALALLGERRGDRFLRQVSAVTYRKWARLRTRSSSGILPVRLDPAAATDLGARLVDSGAGPSQDIAAYVLFERAVRSGSGCAPALNLLLLHAGEAPDLDYGRTIAAGERAVAACGNDPTASWLLGQVESMFDLGPAWSGCACCASRTGPPRRGAARRTRCCGLALHHRAPERGLRRAATLRPRTAGYERAALRPVARRRSCSSASPARWPG